MTGSLQGKVLVTGAAGMLGSQLLKSAPTGVTAVGTDLIPAPEGNPPFEHAGVDLSSPEGVAALLDSLGPLAGVIHGAAYTAVDKAEEEEEPKEPDLGSPLHLRDLSTGAELVRADVLVRVSSSMSRLSARALAMPKSSTLISPDSVIMTFAGLRSRCTMPISWATSLRISSNVMVSTSPLGLVTVQTPASSSMASRLGAFIQLRGL